MSRLAASTFPVSLASAHVEALGFIDTDGRPLGEGAVPGALSAVVTDWKECSYAGSRYHHAKPMNVSALRQVTTWWSEALQIVAALRSECPPWRCLNVLDLSSTWSLAVAATSIPNFLVHRAHDAVARTRIPVIAAVVYKAASGLFQVVEHYALHGMRNGIGPGSVVSPERLLAHAESHQLFEGRAGVCAGPPHMILELLSLVIHGRSGHGTRRAMQALVGDVDRFLRFADAVIVLQRVKQVVSLQRAAIEAELDAIQGHASPSVASPADLLRACVLDPHARRAALKLADDLKRHLRLDQDGSAPSAAAWREAASQFERAGDAEVAAGRAYAALLNDALPVLQRCHGEIASALGYDAPARPFSAADIVQCVGPSQLEQLVKIDPGWRTSP